MKHPRLVLTSVMVAATVGLSGCQESPLAELDSEHREAPAVGDTLTVAQAADGTYISWREHIVDDLAVGGVPIDGSDGLTGGDLDGDGIMDVVSVHESDTTEAANYSGQYDNVADGHIRLAFGSEDPVNTTPLGRSNRVPPLYVVRDLDALGTAVDHQA